MQFKLVDLSSKYEVILCQPTYMSMDGSVRMVPLCGYKQMKYWV